LVPSSASNEKLVYACSAGAGVVLVGGLFARAEYEYQISADDVEH
jgi:opacity protein-like surface antigen